MKPTYRHLIKILSCSLAIAAVLLCSVCVPAYATPVIYDPLNFVDDVQVTPEGNTRYRFRFYGSPYYQVYNESNFVCSFDGRMDWDLDTGYSFYRVSTLPLGGPSYDSYMIDIRDFKIGSVVNLRYDAIWHMDIATGGSNSLTYSVRSQLYLYWFDESFNLISSTPSSVRESEGTWGNPNDVFLLQNSYSYSIPENACFVAPRYMAQFSDPVSGDIIRITSSYVPFFDIIVEKEDIVSEALLKSIDSQLGDLNDTAEDIKSELGDLNNAADDINNQLGDLNDKTDEVNNQLGDLNDKADEMISGTDQMQDASGDFSGTADNAQKDMDSALDQLEQMPEVHEDDVDLTFSGLFTDKDFKKFSNFFMTLSQDTLWISMMLIVCTFVWVSTLLYGKRG